MSRGDVLSWQGCFKVRLASLGPEAADEQLSMVGPETRDRPGLAAASCPIQGNSKCLVGFTVFHTF